MPSILRSRATAGLRQIDLRDLEQLDGRVGQRLVRAPGGEQARHQALPQAIGPPQHGCRSRSGAAFVQGLNASTILLDRAEGHRLVEAGRDQHAAHLASTRSSRLRVEAAIGTLTSSGILS